MIGLIKNEFKKFSKLKVFISSFALVACIFLIIYLNKDKNSNDILNTVFNLIPFVSVLICVLFGSIMSMEFQSGTVRIYLTKPYKRWKILLSKLLFIYLYILFTFIVVICSYFLIMLIYKNYLIDISIIKDIMVHFIPVLFVGTLVLFLSVSTNNSALSVGLSIFICFVSNIIAQLLFGFEYNIFQYTFLSYIDFSIFKDYEYINLMKEELGIALTIKKGIIILIMNMIFLLLLSLNIFVKKDIKN